EADVGPVAVAEVDLLGHAQQRAEVGERRVVAADVDDRVLGPGGRLVEREGDVGAGVDLLEVLEHEGGDRGLGAPVAIGGDEGGQGDAGDGDRALVVDAGGAVEVEQHDLGVARRHRGDRHGHGVGGRPVVGSLGAGRDLHRGGGRPVGGDVGGTG